MKTFLIGHSGSLQMYDEDQIDDILSKNFGEVELTLWHTDNGIVYSKYDFSTREQFENVLKIMGMTPYEI